MTKLERGGDFVTAHIDDGKAPRTATFERVIAAVGVVGNVENLGLEALGVKMERGTIVTDERLPHLCARPLRHRRRRRPAHAGPQGRA